LSRSMCVLRHQRTRKIKQVNPYVGGTSGWIIVTLPPGEYVTKEMDFRVYKMSRTSILRG
jgi:hypothetical protein